MLHKRACRGQHIELLSVVYCNTQTQSKVSKMDTQGKPGSNQLLPASALSPVSCAKFF